MYHIQNEAGKQSSLQCFCTVFLCFKTGAKIVNPYGKTVALSKYDHIAIFSNRILKFNNCKQYCLHILPNSKHLLFMLTFSKI